MRVLIFAGYYYPHIGGYEKNIHELAQRLALRGHDITIVTCNTENSIYMEYRDGVRIFRLPCIQILNKTYPVIVPSLELVQLFCHFKADVVITQTRFFNTTLLGFIYSKIKRTLLIHVERGTCHSVVANKVVDFLCQLYDHTIGSLIIKSAICNIGVSNEVAKFIEHLGGKNVKVIYNGIEVQNIIRTNDITSKKIIIYVGRLIYAKGVQDLIKAFKIVRSKTALMMKLWIVGNGNYRDKLVNLADGDKYIEFLGQQSYDSVNQLLAMSDVFVNPSYSEGLPTSVMEAVSHGVPVIATDVGGTREILKYGWFLKPRDIDALANTLLVCLQNSAVIEEHAKEDRLSLIEKFNWNKISSQYNELLCSVMKEKCEKK